jgi:hypothetical protein
MDLPYFEPTKLPYGSIHQGNWATLLVAWVAGTHCRNFKRNGKTIDASGKTIYAPYEYE